MFGSKARKIKLQAETIEALHIQLIDNRLQIDQLKREVKTLNNQVIGHREPTELDNYLADLLVKSETI